MKPHSWLPLFGSVNVEENSITLVPVPPPPTTPAAPPTTPLALVRSNVDFEQGDVEFDVFLPTSDSACQVVLNSGTHSELFAGLNVFAAPYGFAAFANAKWEPLQTTGQGSALKAPAKYKLRVSVQGSSVDLSVNGVKVATVTHQVVRAPLGILLQSSGAVSVSNFQIKAQQSTAFVVMQFTDEYNSLFKDVIKPTCEEYRYKVIRADDFYTSGLILNDITRSIRDSTLVIADVTPDNANVFYELGYAHGIGKSTILLSDRKRERLPFDISGFRTLFYDNTIGGKSAVEERLRRHLEALGASQEKPPK